MEDIQSHPLLPIVSSLIRFRSSLLCEECLSFNEILASELFKLSQVIDSLTEDVINSNESSCLGKAIGILLHQIWTLFYLRQNAQDEVKSLLLNNIGTNLFIEEASSEGFQTTKKNNHPTGAIQIIKDWLLNHLDDPYPTQEEKEMLCSQSQLTMTQLSDWFVNARRRILNKMRNS